MEKSELIGSLGVFYYSYVGWLAGLSDTIMTVDTLMTIQ